MTIARHQGRTGQRRIIMGLIAIAAVKREAARPVAERTLLPEDAERAVEAAKQGKLGQ